jgi:integrase/recombinase XerD
MPSKNPRGRSRLPIKQSATAILPSTIGTEAFDSLPERVRLRIASYSRNTQRALRSDWRVYSNWCANLTLHSDGRPRQAFPLVVSTLVEFVKACSPPIVRHRDGTLEVDAKAAGKGSRSAATVSRYLNTLRVLHSLAEWPGDPTRDIDVLAIRRIVMRGRSGSIPRAPLRLDNVTKILELKGSSHWLLRDKAIVAVAYSGMLRRSEVVALNVDDINGDRANGSATITIRRSKTDQEGKGRTAFLSAFAATALRRWLRAGKITSGPLFRRIMPDRRVGTEPLNEREVARIFKRLATRIGIDSKEVGMIAGHSTRIGGAHDLMSEGYDLAAIMQAGRWSSPTMPARYTRELDVKNSAMAKMLSGIASRTSLPAVTS